MSRASAVLSMMMWMVCASTVIDARAQALAPQNAAQRVAAAYRFNEQLQGYEFLGTEAAPDPKIGVSASWRADEDEGQRFDVFLYQAQAARVPGVALREAFERFSQELRDFYTRPGNGLDEPLADPESLTWKMGGIEWPGLAHHARISLEGTRLNSYTLLFYQLGHLIKLRASAPPNVRGARRLARQSQAFMKSFLERLSIEQPFGHHCGMPELVSISLPDTRVGTFSPNDHAYYIADSLDEKGLADELARVVQASLARSSAAGCFGQGMKVEASGGHQP